MNDEKNELLSRSVQQPEKSSDIERKTKDAKQGPEISDEAAREWLREAATRAEVTDIERHVAWGLAHFGALRSLILNPLVEEKEEAGKALNAAGPLLILQLKNLSENRVADSERWVQFAKGTLAATLRRQANLGKTPEDIVDALLAAIRPLRPRAASSLSDFCLRAGAYLTMQGAREIGYYKTRGALADLLSELKDKDSLCRRAFLYLEILREFKQRNVAGGAWASIVNADANNLAASLDDLEQMDDSARLMALAVSAGSAARQKGADQSAAPESATGLSQFFRKEVDAEWSALLDDMANVPGTWRNSAINGSSTLMLLVEVAAAAARAGFDGEVRKVASTLFNAGVSILKMAREDGSWQNDIRCRLAFNGGGLFWALSAGMGDGRESVAKIQKTLEQNSGMDCAVNLMGAIADWRNGNKGLSDDPLLKFTGALLGAKNAGMAEEFSRVDNALRKMTITPEVASPMGLLPALVELLMPIFSEEGWQNAWKDLAAEPSAVTLGAFLRVSVEAGLGQQASTQIDQLGGRLTRFAEEGESWPAVFEAMVFDDLDSLWQLAPAKEWQDYSERFAKGEASLPDLLIEMADDLLA